MTLASRHAKLVKDLAKKQGFEYCGISTAGFLEKEAPQFEKWLKQGMHGEMAYMENHFDKRLDPRKLVDSAKSVISLLLNYFPPEEQKEGAPKISRYAYGRDYHKVIKKKMKALMREISEEIGEINGRAFVDSAPVMDKAWARRSGLGWIGKHTNLINKKSGSYLFVAEIISDLELTPDHPIKDFCGDCTRCLDACPTDALHTPYQIDASRCISYLNIELKKSVPEEFKKQMSGWLYGCDICQEVCPWNRFSKKSKHFPAKDWVLEASYEEWEEVSKEVFDEELMGSAMKRAGYEKLKDTLKILKSEN